MKIKLPFPFSFTLDDYLLLAMQPAERQSEPATVAAILHISDENAQTFVATFSQWRKSRVCDARIITASAFENRYIPKGCELDSVNVMHELKLISTYTRDYLIGASSRHSYGFDPNKGGNYLTKINWQKARNYAAHVEIKDELIKLQKSLEAAQSTARFTPEAVANGKAEACDILKQAGVRKKMIKRLFTDAGAKVTHTQYDSAIFLLRSRGMDEGMINRLLPGPETPAV